MKKMILILIIVPIISYAQRENDSWNFSGHIQLRSELDGRDFSNKTHPLTFTSLRTRVGVEKNIFDKLNFFCTTAGFKSIRRREKYLSFN